MLRRSGAGRAPWNSSRAWREAPPHEAPRLSAVRRIRMPPGIHRGLNAVRRGRLGEAARLPFSSRPRNETLRLSLKRMRARLGRSKFECEFSPRRNLPSIIVRLANEVAYALPTIEMLPCKASVRWPEGARRN